MSKAKKASRLRRPKKTLPVLGAAGVSLALANGAQASVIGMTTAALTHPGPFGHEIMLCEEDVSGVGLATFRIFDKGSFDKSSMPRVRMAGCACAGADFYTNQTTNGGRETAQPRRPAERAQPYARPKPPQPPANQTARQRPQPEIRAATTQSNPAKPPQSNAATPAQSTAAKSTTNQGAAQQGGPELSGPDATKSSN